MSMNQVRRADRVEHLGADPEKPEFFDLSTTGVCCHSARRHDKDSVVKVQVGELSVRGRVVYCMERTDGFRIGLHFVEQTPEARKAMEDVVEKYSRGVPLKCGIAGEVITKKGS